MNIEDKITQQIITLEKANYLMIGGIVLVCFVLFGFAGFYLGKQSSKLELIANEKQNQVSPRSSLNVSNPEVNENKITQPIANCISTFSSKFIKLTFKYDSCAWKLNENLITPESGTYSIITAKHNSNYQVVINANTMGMGGGYPGCYQVSDVSLLDSNIVRVKMIKNPMGESSKYYHYLNAQNDYAIKGYSGKFGDDKFKEYFTFLNSEAFPDTNMCWRSSGINPVSIQQPIERQTESFQINKDITVSIEEENLQDKDFLKAADALAVSIYSSVAQ